MYSLRKDSALKFLQLKRKINLGDYSAITRDRLLTHIPSQPSQIKLKSIIVSLDNVFNKILLVIFKNTR